MSIGDINAKHPDLLMAGRGLGQPADVLELPPSPRYDQVSPGVSLLDPPSRGFVRKINWLAWMDSVPIARSTSTFH